MKVEPQKLGSWRQNHIFQLCVLDIVNSPCICRCLLGITVQVSACTEHKVHAHSTKCMHRTADFSSLQLQWNVSVHAVAQCRLQLESWQQCNWGPNSTVQFDGECKGTILWGHCKRVQLLLPLERPTLPFENAPSWLLPHFYFYIKNQPLSKKLKANHLANYHDNWKG